MRKHIIVSAVVAVIVAFVTIRIADEPPVDAAPDIDMDALVTGVQDGLAAAGSTSPRVFSYTTELVEDSWVNGSRTTGSDNKPLSSIENSICFLTKVEIKGIQGPDDSNSCAITVDDFTGFWEVTATVAEGGQSEVRCNARCLVWE